MLKKLLRETVLLSALLMIMLPGFVRGQGSANVPLRAHVNMYPASGYNDCWGYTAPDGREYALLGVRTGTSIIDITDTNNPTEVTFISGNSSSWRDIKTYQHYAYVVNESGGGMHIIDLSGLPGSAALAATYSGFNTSHNIYIDVPNAMLYAEGSFQEPVRAISLANPLAPVQVSYFGIECHDVYARDNIVYVSEGGSGSLGVFNLTNAAAPSLVVRIPVPASGYVHNAWLSDDGKYLMSTEETTGKTIKLWDIQNLNNAFIADSYLAPGGLAHNTHVKGDYAYISHYVDGLRIVDISDPDNIFEAGYYDTYPQPGNGYNGAWGAFPFFNSGKVLISDMQTGLYVVYFDGAAMQDPDIAVIPLFHNYGDVQTCATASKTFQVINTGTANLEVAAAVTIGPNADEFSVTGGGAPFTVPPAQSHDLVVTFAPTASGTKMATLTIFSNDPDENPYEVGLAGNAIGEAEILGDVDENFLANSTDGLIVLSYDAGLPIPQPILDRINAGIGDVDASGATNSTDALIILSFDAGLTVPFPVGQPFCP